LGKTWRKTVIDNLKESSHHVLERLRRTTINFGYDSCSLGQGSNLGTPEYETQA
jgi:hypothetical protein